MTSLNLEFPAGSAANAMQCISITIIDDIISEEDELFLVILTLTSNLTVEGNAVTNVTIINDDCKH